jgi:CheY-like chemotaxis protein
VNCMDEIVPPLDYPYSSHVYNRVPTMHQFRLLIVDDNEEILFVTKRILERFRTFVIDTACSAQSGLEKLKECRYDVILSDYEMPEINGIVFFETIRHMGDMTPFVIYSHKTEAEIKNIHTILEKILFLEKGIEPRCIYDTLIGCINQRLS